MREGYQHLIKRSGKCKDEKKNEAKQRFDEGVRLSEQRDSGKGKFDDMYATEQEMS